MNDLVYLGNDGKFYKFDGEIIEPLGVPLMPDHVLEIQQFLREQIARVCGLKIEEEEK